ncbi:MAG: hypothetical protein V1663_03245 [archaeon]
MGKKFIDLKEYIPDRILSGDNEKEIKLNINIEEYYIDLSYITEHFNDSWREHSTSIPRRIKCNEETFEVLGLLQAEMGKTNNGCLVFANSEYRLIKKVMEWFNKELELNFNNWRWYIRLNMQEPNDLDYKKEIENKIINYWLSKTKINDEIKYPKTVTYTKNSNYTKLKNCYYGTLMIEHKSKLFSQIIKSYVKNLSYNLHSYDKKDISSFIKGVLAGESCVEIDKKCKKYRIHLTANNSDERNLYQEYLNKIGIEIKQYKDYKDMIISKRENLVKLLKQRLMCLSPSKYSKFLFMMQEYPDISNQTGYFTGEKKIWNKIPEEKIEKIIELYNSGTTRTLEIAEKVGVSQIKVQRVLKENNLGERVVKTDEEKRNEIADFIKENMNLSNDLIAKQFRVHESVVRRICKKYKIDKGNKSRCKIPQEKIQKIIDIYKENPTVKFSEIMDKVRVSDSVIIRVRKENSLENLGYKHLIGNNNHFKESKILKN